MENSTHYNGMVDALVKPADDLVDMMVEVPTLAHLNHMALGLAGETGELIDAIKKHTIYGKPVDMPNILEELGDIEFYLQGIRSAFGVTREMCLATNQAKLEVRYASGNYSDRQAIDRADKGQGS